MDGTGKIEEIALKEGRLTFKISGRYYSLWAPRDAPQEEKDEVLFGIQKLVHSGDFVSFTYTEKANPTGGAAYKNIQTIKKSTPPTTGTTNNQNDAGREESIRRQVSMKVAAEFLKACPESIDEKTPLDTLIAAANAIDAWFKTPASVPTNKEVIKKEPKADMEVVEEDFP